MIRSSHKRAIRQATPLLVVIAFFALALLFPLNAPPYLPSIQTGARAIDQSGLAPVKMVQARDGQPLGYRLYPAAPKQAGEGRASDARRPTSDLIALLIHGSSGSGRSMTAVAQALAEAGITAVAMDIRGHGVSGPHGDIAYVGQLEDDLQDVLAALQTSYPNARFALVGHSSGGGFALRVAGGPLGQRFSRIALLAPYLGHDAPTTREAIGAARWAEPNIPRIIALTTLNSLGVKAFDGLPVLAFAIPPESQSTLTGRYSWRLMRNFAVPMGARGASDFRGAFERSEPPIAIIAGADDELMDSARYAEATAGLESKVKTTIIPRVDHMGIVRDVSALAALIAVFKQ